MYFHYFSSHHQLIQYFHNKIMKKERVIKNYQKPPLNLICPLNYTKKISPTLLLKQNWDKQFQIQDQQSLDQVLLERKKMANTHSEWHSRSAPVAEKDLEENELEGKGVSQSIVKKKKVVEFRKSLKKSSPYVKNAKDFNRMLLMLKPVAGPTQSLMNQIKKHNTSNRKNVEHVLMNSKQSFKQKLSKFSNRIGLANNQKIFVMNSKDSHIRTALQSNGWVEALDKNTTFFHLKWVYTDSASDYAKLQAGQFYNHFKNNQELTNKNLLRKNLKKASPSLRPNFPQTFDLQLGEDQIKFKKEFLKNELFSEISFWAQQLCKQQPTKFERIRKHKGYILSKQTIEKSGKVLFSLEFNPTQNRKIASILEPSFFKIKQNEHLKPYRQYIYNLCQVFEKNLTKNTLKLQRRRLSVACQQTLPKQIKQIMPLLRGSFKNIDSVRKQQAKVENVIHSILEVLKQDSFIRAHLVSLYLANKESYQNTFGFLNSWIVKPTGVSRGLGIKIQQEIQQISNNKYGKIVQKYIQKPLLLTNGKKFDIRQWVLVKSFTPLEAYTFRNCYCRFSAQKYEQKNLQNLLIHLTNYSKQKQAFSKDNSEQYSILSEQQLIKQLLIVKPSVEWSQLRKQMNTQILKTLKCCQYEIQQQSQCFEVYGFDILLDQQCRPWVLEINMSPACQIRAEFLHSYLREMSEGILDILEDNKPRNWDILVEQQLLNRPQSTANLILEIEGGQEQKAARFIQKYWKSKNRKVKVIPQKPEFSFTRFSASMNS